MNKLIKHPKVNLANRFVEAIYKIDTREKKMLCAIVNAVQTSGDNEIYSFPVANLAKQGGIDSSSIYRDLKDIMLKLIDITVKYADDEKEEFEFFHFVNDAKYKAGMLEFSLSRQFKKCIFQLKAEFTRYLLQNIRPMRSVYSIRLYELLKQYQNIGNRTFEIDELKTILGAEYKKSFSSFRRRVLECAKKEINTHTDIFVTYELERWSHSYKYVHFSISENALPKELKEKEEQPELFELHEEPEYLYFEKELKDNGVKFSLKELLKKLNIHDWEILKYYWDMDLKYLAIKEDVQNRGKFIFNKFADRAVDCWTMKDKWIQEYKYGKV